MAFVAVVDLLAGVDKLELELDAIGGDGLVGVEVDCARDRVIAIEGALVTLENDVHVHAVKLRFLGSHAIYCFFYFFMTVTIPNLYHYI